MSARKPIPPREELEKLYRSKTTREIARLYDVSTSLVCAWFIDLGIKARNHNHPPPERPRCPACGAPR